MQSLEQSVIEQQKKVTRMGSGQNAGVGEH